MRRASSQGRLRHQRTFKIVVLGDAGTGKSSLITRFVDGTFASRSAWNVGVELRTIHIDNESVKLQIWNTSGQERFRSIAPSFYSGADGLILVYDITSRESLHSVRRWMEDALRNSRTSLPHVLVGNKSDLEKEREVSLSEGLEMAGEFKAPFYEVSSKIGGGVQDTFRTLARNILAIKETSLSESRDKTMKRVN